MRLLRAVRELNLEHDWGMRTIALHTEAERRAMFVREADETVLIAGQRPYLDHGELARALRASGADAAWVGWGFVAEDPAFAEMCADIGVAFIGPPSEVMRRLGDKIGAKLLAEQLGVPVAAWSRGPVETVDAAVEHARTIGYPVVIKARAGGGGRGIRFAACEEELAPAFERARAEALLLVRRRDGIHRAPDHRRAPGRGSGHRRPPRRRLGCGRARLLDPAPQPEADRGVELPGAQRRAGARAAGCGRQPGPVSRLSQRRHRRVPLPTRPAGLRVPRGQPAPPGRAPRHRSDDGARPREAAAPRCRGRAPGGGAATRVRPRDRGPAQRRGPRTGLRPRRPGRSSA